MSKFPKWVLEYNQETKTPLNYNLFETTDKSEIMSLMPFHVGQVRKALIKELGDKKIKQIEDKNAHIGVDTINFAYTFPKAKIIAYEQNPKTIQVLERNLKTFSDEESWQDRFIIKNFDSSIFNSLPKTELIYYDPPWSGNWSSEAENFILTLGGFNLDELVLLDLQKENITVIVKAPPNISEKQIKKMGEGNRYEIKTSKGKVSYLLFFFHS